jgi:hypothetical protein
MSATEAVAKGGDLMRIALGEIARDCAAIFGHYALLQISLIQRCSNAFFAHFRFKMHDLTMRSQIQKRTQACSQKAPSHAPYSTD